MLPLSVGCGGIMLLGCPMSVRLCVRVRLSVHPVNTMFCKPLRNCTKFIHWCSSRH